MPAEPHVVGPTWDAPPAPPPPPVVTLHPNLARIAVRYQRVCERLNRGELGVLDANRQIRELIARDDQGLPWTINPADGGWLYWSRAGAWKPADPPTSGLASVTPYDLATDGGNRLANPDAALTLRKVSDDSATLVGSTRRRAARQRPLLRPAWVYPTLALVAVAIAIFVAVAWVGGQGDPAPMAPPPSIPAGY